MSVQTVKELEVYVTAYRLSMMIFEVSKKFPDEERYSLTSQIRRSSRSVCLNLREAWAKRRYEAHFVSKLTDCDGESNETDSSLDFARDCGYLSTDRHAELVALNRSVGKMLGALLS
jgi:four helix bundle protein